jgi:hypothetical protein
MPIDIQEQNWNNFCAHHLHDWHGIWTSYSAQGEVKDSFQSLRSFRANLEKTQITHTNRYIYADGKIEEKTWQLQKPFLRSIFFPQGAGAFHAEKLVADSFFAVELFFIHQNLRHSAIAAYTDGTNLTKILSIREDSTGFPSQHWSTNLDLVSERSLSENWAGTSVTMTPDLKVSPAVPANLNWQIEGNKSFFFPDEISLSCPRQVEVGKPIVIAATWLVNSSYLQQITIAYDETGAFQNLKFAEFTHV